MVELSQRIQQIGYRIQPLLSNIEPRGQSCSPFLARPRSSSGKPPSPTPFGMLLDRLDVSLLHIGEDEAYRVCGSRGSISNYLRR